MRGSRQTASSSGVFIPPNPLCRLMEHALVELRVLHQPGLQSEALPALPAFSHATASPLPRAGFQSPEPTESRLFKRDAAVLKQQKSAMSSSKPNLIHFFTFTLPEFFFYIQVNTI